MIQFSPLFEVEFENKLDIKREEVTQAITEPDQSQELVYRKLKLNFYLKKLPDKYLLVQAQNKDPEVEVDAAYELQPGFVEELGVTNPWAVLKYFVFRFGLVFRIGEMPWIIVRGLSLPLSSPDMLVPIIPINPQKKWFIQTAYIKKTTLTAPATFDIALAYFFDVEKYLQWWGKST